MLSKCHSRVHAPSAVLGLASNRMSSYAAFPRSMWDQCGPRCSTSSTGSSSSDGTLSTMSCVPCEEDGGALEQMGLCEALGSSEAQKYLEKLQDGWDIQSDTKQQLHLSRTWRAKNFKAALELSRRFGQLAEDEGHHPDLHLTDWNRLRVELWTHSRGGLTVNDFILAAKLDSVDKEGLLRGKKKTFDSI